jgi:hypothetical protein
MIKTRLPALILTLLGSTLPVELRAQPSLASTVAALDRGFICPEFLADDAARAAEQRAFSRALLASGPRRISFREANYIRARLLERHGCGRQPMTSTLADAGRAGATAAGAAN